MEPQNDLLRVLVPNPVRLRAPGQCDALGREPVILRVLEVDGRAGAVHVAILCGVEASQLHAHHAEDDVFVVVVRAALAFEGRYP